MPNRTSSPPRDRFASSELQEIAPWVAEEIDRAGPDNVRAMVRAAGENPDEPQRVQTWVAAIARLQGPFWEALNVA